jgi:hypothetical protein
MRKALVTGLLVSGILGFSSAAWSFQCPTDFSAAETAIESATKAMEGMSDKEQMGLVHTLIDDAKMMLSSAKHNHEKPAAGALDHARAIAKARAAKGYAEAAEMMATH